jgi:hypothetical protein
MKTAQTALRTYGLLLVCVLPGLALAYYLPS